MKRRIARINDMPISEAEQSGSFIGRRPGNRPGLSELGF